MDNNKPRKNWGNLMIPYGHQDIHQSDVNAVIEVLNSDFLTQGPKTPSFERLVAEYAGAKYATAVNSATSALHLACLSLDLGSGDLLWTTPITFVASANCGLYCGARIDFVDIDPLTFNICPKLLYEKLINAQKKGMLPKILVAVHMGGQSCDMAEIYTLGKKFGFKVIEDASHGVGGKYQNNAIGSCLYSDITIFSFHPVKIITTAEGGMALTNSRHLKEKMDLLRSHGISRDQSSFTRKADGPWYYEQIELGFNYRMTELQAALGISQMSRLNNYIAKRRGIAERYNRHLSDLPISLPYQNNDCESSWHLYIIRLNPEKAKKTHLSVFEELRQQGIGVQVHYIPVHLQPYYQINFDFKYGDFPNAEKFYKEAITLPIYPTLTVEEQDKVISALNKSLNTTS